MKTITENFGAIQIALYDVVQILASFQEFKSATKFITPKLCVTATCRFPARARQTRQEFALTIGAPNYRGRKFVADCLKAKEPFPVKKLRVVRWPDRKVRTTPARSQGDQVEP